MRRYWIEPESFQGTSVHIKDDVFHHIHEVCRVDVGDRFEVLVGDGRALLVQVERVGKKDLVAQVLETRVVAPLQKPFIHLALSIPRFHVFDAVLEKAVELGVHTIHPFTSEFSFMRDQKKLSEKRARWEKIIRSATQQSGRGEMMQLSKIGDLSETIDIFNRSPGAKGLFSYEGAGELDVRQALGALKKPEEIWVFVGSEGGYSSKEVELFRGFGLQPVTLGSQVLRVETACVALVSVIKYEFELMK